MKKSTKVMMVFSIVFTTITIFFFAFATTFAVNSLVACYKPNADVGDVIGGVFLFIAMLPFCLGMFISAASILPFNLITMLKLKIRNGYTISILIFAIVMMVLSIAYCIAFPLATSIAHPNNTSSSSASA